MFCLPGRRMAASFRFRRYIVGFVCAQTIFILFQVFVFYPCVVRAPLDLDLLKREADTTNLDAQFDQTVPYPYAAHWESLDNRPIPSWYENAKLGIFIHWGVYAVPGYAVNGPSEWFWYWWKIDQDFLQRRRKAKVITGESVKKFVADKFSSDWQYSDFAPQFSGEFFNPEKWVDIFKASGARYVVLTSKHHDGFALWPSKYSWNWNSVDNGPHIDIIGNLSAAIRKNTDLRFGLYHSLYEWYNPLYMRDKANGYWTQDYVKAKLMPELHDIVETYKPDIVWADGQWEASANYWNSTQFLAWLYNQSPVKDYVVTNDRWGNETNCKHGGFLTCSDRYTPDSVLHRKWENCMTIDRNSWGYRRHADLADYFTIEQLVHLLIKTVSKGGNLLMNVGPTADGMIPPVFEERFRQMGEWMGVNGEAIYGTRAWRVQNEGDTIWYTSKQTTSGLVIYVHLLKWPQSETLLLKTPKAKATTKVTWLGFSKAIQHKTDPSALTVVMPRVFLHEIPCQWAWVFKLEGFE
ncbi:alpha-L-fucosidase isoform X1 [Lingula anatina]|uniref:alpha-L-fucosidase n=2 Tax=Lingula anatina TaxID=7574 RepID=A0A1S3JH92_LINAN|nr:alpha-L-fucosidase isoform X1 [Lingula anatina]|eukprot:XP_013409767.1 alpha-L-fucosidase isoform X1 [Lingula anatina]